MENHVGYLIYLQIPIFGLVFFLLWFFHTKHREKRRGILEEIVARRGGRVFDRGFFFLPSLIFQQGATEVTVTTKPRTKNSPPMTRAVAQTGYGEEMKLVLYKEDAFQKALKLFGYQDIIIGNDLFDSAFVIKASDQMAAARVLNGTVQEKLLLLTRKGFSMTITRDRFEMVVHYIPSGASEYDPFLDAVAAVLDQLKH